MSVRFMRLVRPLMCWGLSVSLGLTALGSVHAAPSVFPPAQTHAFVPASIFPASSTLLDPPGRLGSADLVLRRDSAPRSLTLVVPSQVSATTLASRYGVAQGAVQLLPAQGGARLARLPLARASARPPRRPASVLSYAVQPGDTLASIAGRFGLRVVELLGVNLDRRSLDQLQVGETLNVPRGARGLLIRIKPGQTALSLIAGYRADLQATARANGALPTALGVGDELLLPGVRAEGFEQQLLARRDAERRAAVAAEQQRRYDRFVLWTKDRERQRLREQQRRQEQYDRSLAWQRSEERQAQVRAYERQLQLEAALAETRERERLAARAAAARPAATVQRASTGSGPLAWPMRSYRLTSRYAERDIAFHQQVFHGGIDLAAAYGTPIYAAAAGQVSKSGYGDYGLNVFTVSGDATLVYGHMSRVAVYAGQSVAAGQLIGYVGCSGICTGPHLHFEVRVRGQTIDPLAVLP